MANPLTINILLVVFRQFSVPLERCVLGSIGKAVLACLLLIFGGCMFLRQTPVNEPKPVEAALPAKPTALTEEAEAALKAAEQSVIDARNKRALWTAAVEHLAKAREAAKNFDSGATLSHARETIALCALSLQQLSAPPVKW
jgi:Tfp pilus assembly protein PilN